MNTAKLAARLRRHPVFADVSASSLEAIASTASTKTYDRRALVCTRGSTVSAVAFVLGGRIDIERTTTEGRRVVFRTLGPDALVGISSAVGAPLSADVFATPTTSIAWISVAPLRDDVAVLRGALRYLADLVDKLSQEKAEVMYREASYRLVSHILEIAGPSVPTAKVTHETLAALLGCSRSYVTELLQPLEDAGFLKRGRSKLEILDRRRLAALLTRRDQTD